MRVVLSTIGKFHTFSLARQLYQRGFLERIFTGYPCFKLTHEGFPVSLIDSWPWLSLLGQAHRRLRWNSQFLTRQIEWQERKHFDSYTSARLPACDAFIGLSGSALKTGLRARQRGALYVCDRGSSHARYQNDIIKGEYRRHGARFQETHPDAIAQEEAEYAAADVITVPSHFAARSFEEMGVPADKLRVVPYGVDLSRFHPTGAPDPDRFDVLFVGAASFRKGIPYLLEAFAALRHPKKSLTLAGAVSPEVEGLIRAAAATQPVCCIGRQPSGRIKQIMSRSHVLVQPSIEEGLSLVIGEAMACGCPVIATEHTGAQDFLEDGRDGFVVPIRSSEAIASRLQQIADDPFLRERMSASSLACVQSLGGWDCYGSQMAAILEESLGCSDASPQRSDQSLGRHSGSLRRGAA